MHLIAMVQRPVPVPPPSRPSPRSPLHSWEDAVFCCACKPKGSNIHPKTLMFRNAGKVGWILWMVEERCLKVYMYTLCMYIYKYIYIYIHTYNDYSKFKIRVCKGTLSAPFIFQIVLSCGSPNSFQVEAAGASWCIHIPQMFSVDNIHEWWWIMLWWVGWMVNERGMKHKKSYGWLIYFGG